MDYFLPSDQFLPLHILQSLSTTTHQKRPRSAHRPVTPLNERQKRLAKSVLKVIFLFSLNLSRAMGIRSLNHTFADFTVESRPRLCRISLYLELKVNPLRIRDTFTPLSRTWISGICPHYLKISMKIEFPFYFQIGFTPMIHTIYMENIENNAVLTPNPRPLTYSYPLIYSYPLHLNYASPYPKPILITYP